VTELRRALGGVDLAQYAGVAREPIDRWLEPPTEEQLQSWLEPMRTQWADPEGWERSMRADLPEDAFREWEAQGKPGPPDPEEMERLWRAPRPPDPDERAARLMLERLGPDPNIAGHVEFVNSCVLPDLGLAREVHALTGRPDDREVIRVERTSKRAATTLGFDVGQWGGSPFSVILDTMLHPQWHAAPDEEVPELAAFARRLNEHLLFPTAAEAQAFHDWYVAKAWAEIGTFPVIRVDAVPS
jgi:hypothetical protein